MYDQGPSLPTVPSRMPWNKGKLIGAKPPLRPKHVWAIRTRLMVEGRTRDLAMFNLAICYSNLIKSVRLKVEALGLSGSFVRLELF